MLFNSLTYLVFLAVVVALYWLVPQRYKTWLLLIASYIFYMSWIPQYGLLIGGLTLANYACGKWLSATKQPRLALFVAVTVNLGILALFKYASFLAQSLDAVVSFVGFTSDTSWAAKIILPLGISFFVFEFIHYQVDIYRGHKPINSLVHFALFPSFFPTQIAGPIKRYQDFVPQLENLPKRDSFLFQKGLSLIVRGLFKKVVLADTLAIVSTLGFANASQLGFVDAWGTIIAFAFQIYFDFSGYTDIGRGSALLLGFKVPENFNLPYLATNIADFWRRWHITLSSWLRDYLYIPLGGSRGSKLRLYRNLFLTMALGGLWHGAAWTFFIWGAYQGILLIIHRIFEGLKWPLLERFRQSKSLVISVISVLLTFVSVCFGWVFFRASSMEQALEIIKSMVGGNGLLSGNVISETKLLQVFLISAAWLIFVLGVPRFEQTARRWKLPINHEFGRAIYYAGMLVAIILLQPTVSSSFIYFQF